MKICYLANATSIHTRRWAKAMVEKGCTVDVVTFDNAEIEGVNIHYIEPVKRERGRLPSEPKNLTYLLKYRKALKAIKGIKPDIVHAHYATGYGLTGSLCNYHPFIISTWGTDIFQAPKSNALFKNMVKFNLNRTDCVTATSKALSEETSLYTGKKIYTIPFGIDILKFSGTREKESAKITIGIVKYLEKVYGIDYLIQAFERIHKIYENTVLMIVGDGTQRDKLMELCRELNIENDVKFVGKVTNDEVPKYLNMMDIFVMPSISESFGVAALEAEACKLPVIASDVGGIPEVVADNNTGFLVKPGDIDSLVSKMEILIRDKNLRESMGKAARKFVEDNYNWYKNIEDMYKLYQTIIQGKNV